MNKNLFPIYGILAGLGLSYLYIKTLGKDKNLNLVNTLLIGGGIGAGLGSAATLISNMKKQESKITEESILSLAGDVNSIDEVKNYLLIIDKAKLSEQDKERVLRVINGVLLAKKDKKWDENADIKVKKNILLGYKVSEYDFNVFQDVIINRLADLLANIIK
jgi:hypothetical protein